MKELEKLRKNGYKESLQITCKYFLPILLGLDIVNIILASQAQNFEGTEEIEKRRNQRQI